MYHIYIMANWNNNVIYIGFTSDLPARNYSHKKKLVAGFTKKYNCTKLVYFETHDDRQAMLEREKEIKKWRREKKDILITKSNPGWHDLTQRLH